MLRLWLQFACVVGTLSLHSAYAQWGTLRGRVELDGKVPAVKILAQAPNFDVPFGEKILDDSVLVDEKTKGIANVAVWLTKKPAKIHPDLAKSPAEIVELQTAGLKFRPRVLMMRSSQKLKLINQDAVAHDVRSTPQKNLDFSVLLSPQGGKEDRKTLEWKLAERAPIALTSNYHSWMRAYVIVADHPYGTLTDREGNFEIKHLPAGLHEVSIWHERAGWIARDLKQHTRNPSFEIVSNEITDVPVIRVPVKKMSGERK